MGAQADFCHLRRALLADLTCRLRNLKHHSSPPARTQLVCHNARTLIGSRAGMTNSHGRQKTPACGASLGARKTGHRPQQRLHSMWRGQVDCKTAHRAHGNAPRPRALAMAALESCNILRVLPVPAHRTRALAARRLTRRICAESRSRVRRDHPEHRPGRNAPPPRRPPGR